MHLVLPSPPRLRRLLGKAQTSISAMLRDKSGVVLVEFAYCLPILLALGMSGIELTSLQLANMRVSQTALTLADNISRAKYATGLALPQLREHDINDAFLGAGLQSETINLLSNGRLIVSSLQQNASGGQWITWQRCKGTLNITSAYGVEDTGATGTGFGGVGTGASQLRAEPGTMIIVAEVSYRYQPLFTGNFLGPITVKDVEAIYVRDDRSLEKPTNPSPSVTVSACNRFTAT
ncbi:MAG: TadE/TadG family type IV pilus assembly protein [Sphingomonadaceae bacterium]